MKWQSSVCGTLRKNEDTAKAYAEYIRQYLQKGYIRKIRPSEENTKSKWYLPHFAVVRPDKATTKTRIVFDASAKYQGVSLNDVIHQGPKLQRELFDVLLRFRKNPVALVSDISEMYLKIQIAPEDRPYYRFLWRDLKMDTTPDIYEFERVVFGVNCSPFQAQFVTQSHAKAHEAEFPMAVDTVLKSTYMDDSMDSVMNDEQGVELYQQLSELWKKAGMHAHKWLSNSSAVLAHIPIEDRAFKIDFER